MSAHKHFGTWWLHIFQFGIEFAVLVDLACSLLSDLLTSLNDTHSLLKFVLVCANISDLTWCLEVVEDALAITLTRNLVLGLAVRHYFFIAVENYLVRTDIELGTRVLQEVEMAVVNSAN